MPVIGEADDAEEERERDAREREEDRPFPPTPPSPREARRPPPRGGGVVGGGETNAPAVRPLRPQRDLGRAHLRQRDDQLRKATRKGRGWDDAPLPDGEAAALRQHQTRLEGTVAELTSAAYLANTPVV